MADHRDPPRLTQGADRYPEGLLRVIHTARTTGPHRAAMERIAAGLGVSPGWGDGTPQGSAQPSPTWDPGGARQSWQHLWREAARHPALIWGAGAAVTIGVAMWLALGGQAPGERDGRLGPEGATAGVAHGITIVAGPPAPAENLHRRSSPPEPVPAAGHPSDPAPAGSSDVDAQRPERRAPALASGPGARRRTAMRSQEADEAVGKSGAESEARLLRQAREALRSDAARALALVGQHARQYPEGALLQEREVIAVEALIRLDRAPEARRRAHDLLSRVPDTAHRGRIEALLRRAAPGSEPNAP